MTTSNALTASPGHARRTGIAASVTFIVMAGWCWHTPPAGAQDMQTGPSIVAQSVSYPTPGREPMAKTEFPAGAAPISGPEIVAALSDHTAVLPGGFVEYYAPDGKLRGLTEGKHYGGSWEVRNGDFCTLLQDSDASVCSPVERKDNTLYWSVDGEDAASAVSTLPGNPENLQ